MTKKKMQELLIKRSKGEEFEADVRVHKTKKGVPTVIEIEKRIYTLSPNSAVKIMQGLK